MLGSQEKQIHTNSEMRMPSLARGKTKNHSKNEDMWREASIESMTTFLREKLPGWYGHLLRKKAEYTTKKMLNMQVPEKRRRGGPTKMAR